MRCQIYNDFVVDIAPVWMVVGFFCEHRYLRHECEGLAEVRELERARDRFLRQVLRWLPSLELPSAEIVWQFERWIVCLRRQFIYPSYKFLGSKLREAVQTDGFSRLSMHSRLFSVRAENVQYMQYPNEQRNEGAV